MDICISNLKKAINELPTIKQFVEAAIKVANSLPTIKEVFQNIERNFRREE